MEKYQNNDGVDKESFTQHLNRIVMYIIEKNAYMRRKIDTKESLLHAQEKIEKHKSHYEYLNSALYLLQEYKRDASIQLEINMIREATYNTIEHIKDMLN